MQYIVLFLTCVVGFQTLVVYFLRRRIVRLDRVVKWQETIIFNERARSITLEDQCAMRFDFNDGIDKPPTAIIK